MPKRLGFLALSLALAMLIPASFIVSARQTDTLLQEDMPYTQEWLERYHGMFDNRWTAEYEQRLQGMLPQPRWDSTDFLLAPFSAAWGADVRMSSPSFNSQQNEFQIDINPMNSLFAIGTSNDYLTAGVGIYRTSDGGATWTALDAPIGTSACCDPGVSYSWDGKAYVTVLDTSPSAAYVIKSTDNGVTWSSRYTAVSGSVDRQNIVVDNGAASPYRGRVYVTYTDFTGAGRIYGVYSTDEGLTWTPRFPIGGPPPAQGYEQSSQPRVASDGTIYVGFQQYLNSGAGCNAGVENVVARSTNGGATWAQTVLPIVQGGVCLSAQAGRGVFCINSGGQYFRSRSHPILGIHPTNPNIVYMVYSGGDLETPYTCAGGSGYHSDTLFRKSTDGGVTWTAPLKINTDPPGKDQYYPWMDVAPNGTIWVGWHDRREDPNNFRHKWYVAYSTDEGETWTEVAVADQDSQPYTFIGDYAGLAAENDWVLPMWWDSRIKATGDPFTDPHQPFHYLFLSLIMRDAP